MNQGNRCGLGLMLLAICLAIAVRPLDPIQVITVAVIAICGLVMLTRGSQ